MDVSNIHGGSGSIQVLTSTQSGTGLGQSILTI